MDVTALTPLILPYLIRYLPTMIEAGKVVGGKALEKVIDGTTDEVWKLAVPWIRKLLRQIEDRPAALQAAQRLAVSPENADYQIALEAELGGILAADQALAVEIKQILDQANAAGGSYIIADRGGVAIGGSAKDSTIITGGVTQKGDGNIIGHNKT